MKGREFLTFAGKVAVLHTEEAARRSAISRSYYAVMHEAMELLSDNGLPIDARHDNASLDYKASLTREGLRIGQLVDGLRSLRVRADYQLKEDNCASNDVIASIERATEILAMLDELRERVKDTAFRDQFLADIRAARAKTGRRI